MTYTLDTASQEVRLEDLLEQLMLLEDIQAQAVVAAIQAYYDMLERELTVTIVPGQYLYQILKEADLKKFFISAIIDNPTLRDYIC